jgi:hypothetical protein
MNRNKIVIDMTKVQLNDAQRKKLHEAIHLTVLRQLKKIKPEKIKKRGPLKLKRGSLSAREIQTKTANLKIDFTNTNPGLSELTATLNEQSQTVTESTTITFTNVQSGDIIKVKGESLGITTVTIDIDANPTQMNFIPGHFNDNFFIN